jgi:hypothetical protein
MIVPAIRGEMPNIFCGVAAGEGDAVSETLSTSSRRSSSGAEWSGGGGGSSQVAMPTTPIIVIIKKRRATGQLAGGRERE